LENHSEVFGIRLIHYRLTGESGASENARRDKAAGVSQKLGGVWSG
jgi:hypothetical protein